MGHSLLFDVSLHRLVLIMIACFVAAILVPVLGQIDGKNVGGTLIVNLASEPTVIPGSAAWNSGFVAAQIFDSLLSLGPNLELLPGLAIEWKVDASQGAYVFKLRKGVKWHDGRSFTAEDVKFSFEKIISKFHTFGSLYFKDVTVEIQSEDTVIVKPGKFLPGAQLRLFATTETIIYPKHHVEKDSENFLTSPFRTNPIGTGPFKFIRWEKGNFMELARNSDYWDTGKPYLEKIIIRFLSDPASVLAGLQRGEIHYMFRGIPFEAINTLQQSKDLEVYLSTRPPYRAALWLNVKSPPLDNINVRRAIAFAIDRADLAKKATFGFSKPDQWMIDPLQVPPSPNQYIYNHDPAIANWLLDQAGFSRGPDGFRFTIELMTRTGEPDEQLFAQIVRDQLAEVGIKVNIVSVDFATYLAKQQRFEYQMATVKYWIDPLWVYQLFHTEWIGKGAFTNNFQYSNSQVDNLLNQWLIEIDPNKQAELLQKVGDILSRELPAIILYEVIWPNVLNVKFTGPDIPVGKYVFFDPLKDTYYVPSQPKTTIQQTPTITQTQVAERTVFVTRTALYTTTVIQQETNVLMIALPIFVGIIIAVSGILMGRRLGKKG